MDKVVDAGSLIQDALTQAVRNKELSLSYQPIYFGYNNQLVGVEALARWTHPELGAIAPDIFIRIAENSETIHELGAWVMHKACTDVQAWRSAYPHLSLRLRVNVSGQELNCPGFVEQIVKILGDTGLPANQLQIEAAESVFLMRPDSTRKVLEKIRQHGIRVALDGFGTGFGSLVNIDTYPIDSLKIDKYFVSRMLLSEQSQAIVKCILLLGKKLGLGVTAEGVESREQHEHLLAMECLYFQGYYLGSPMSFGRMSILIDKFHRGG